MFEQQIEYIEPIRQNKPDAQREIFEIEGDVAVETIKQCRRNFGQRGDIFVSATLGFSICFVVMTAIVIIGVAIFGS